MGREEGDEHTFMYATLILKPEPTLCFTRTRQCQEDTTSQCKPTSERACFKLHTHKHARTERFERFGANANGLRVGETGDKQLLQRAKVRLERFANDLGERAKEKHRGLRVCARRRRWAGGEVE